MKKTLVIAVAMMLLTVFGVSALCSDSPATDCAMPGDPETAISGTAAIQEGTGTSPEVKYIWVLPDEYVESGTQIDVSPSGERNDIYACLVVGDVESRDTIVDVFTDVYHPDGSFKYQMHATRITDPAEVEACKDAALAAGLISSQDHVDIDYNIFDQPNWYMYKVYLPMYYHQPSGDYEVRGYATDDTSRLSAPNSANFEWVAGTYLELDFNTVNFGTIQPNAWKILNGDTDMGTPNAPTVKNEGNTAVIVGVEFSDFVGQDNLPNKKITEFDAQLRNMITANNYGQIPGEHLEFSSNEQVNFAYPISLCRQEKLDFSIHPPIGVVPDSYAGTVTMFAEPVIVSSPPPGATFPVVAQES